MFTKRGRHRPETACTKGLRASTGGVLNLKTNVKNIHISIFFAVIVNLGKQNRVNKSN